MFELRAAGGDDIPELLAFWGGAAENAGRPGDSGPAVQNLLARDPQALLLAVDAGTGRIIGSVIAGFDGWRCHLYRLAVAPDRRRQGIATALIAQSEARFRELGGARSDAMVLDENVSAQSAWWARGYRLQEDWSRWVRPLP
ncbi:GNAT family N-acetyltransferase [Kineosporia succinea]|uniref:Ribosomal protein S18 acetylase RimI-like enzyme n=1 Tax=Kineosporia succinea TaxID=84632 RepID=A0ABT9PBC0_9ACTN|nr:GNAT family N-acetyltransferase [Kineosporia succinea]MDP9829968.1 ribosomal protein S18 acetylase RimI-like enzyme [Kineosporia succinea]